MVNQLVFDTMESILAEAFLVMGIFAVVWGMQAYLAGSQEPLTV